MNSDHIRAAETSVPVEKSRADVISALSRYGASGFGFRTRGDIVTVTFHMDTPKGERTVEIPVDVERVRVGLNARALAERRQRNKKAGEATREQAERVAWRALLLWIESALLAVTLGGQTLEDAFFAHLVVTDETGQAGRMADYFASIVSADSLQRFPSADRFRKALGAGRST